MTDGIQKTFDSPVKHWRLSNPNPTFRLWKSGPIFPLWRLRRRLQESLDSKPKCEKKEVQRATGAGERPHFLLGASQLGVLVLLRVVVSPPGLLRQLAAVLRLVVLVSSRFRVHGPGHRLRLGVGAENTKPVRPGGKGENGQYDFSNT